MVRSTGLQHNKELKRRGLLSMGRENYFYKAMKKVDPMQSIIRQTLCSQS